MERLTAGLSETGTNGIFSSTLQHPSMLFYLVPGYNLAEQAFYGGLRYGLYAPIRNLMGVSATTPKSEIPLYTKFAAGGTAGALAAFLATPTDLMKVGQRKLE